MRHYLFLVVFWATALTAQSQTTKSLTLEEAVRLGIEASQQLKTSGAKLDATKAKTLQYWNAVLPNVSLNSAYTRVSDNITPYSFKYPGATEAVVLNPQVLNQFTNRLSVQAFVFTGWRAKNFYESAQFLEKAAGLDIERDKIDVKNNISAAYLNLLKLQTSRQVITESGNVLRGRLNDIKSYVKNGTALENDQLKAEIAVSQLDLTAKEFDNAIEVANFNLDLMLGLPTITRIEVDKKMLFEEKSISDLTNYLASLDTRPDLMAADLRNKATAKGVEIAKGAMLPTVSVGGNAYLNNPNQRVFPQQDAFKGTWDLGIQLSYNLTSLYTSKAQIQEAQANVAVANAQRQQLSDAAKMEVNANYFAYQSALEKIKLTEKVIVQATENQRVIKNRFQAQVALIGEMLEADSLVVQAKLNLEAAKADAEVAYYKLQKSVGK
jgi:outer membrane protein